MKHIIAILLISFCTNSFSQIVFSDYFIEKTLRFDYIRAGNSDTSFICYEQLKQEPYWGGSLINLVDTFMYGDYQLQVFDSIGTKLIYSRCYSSLFREWLDTDESKMISKSFYEAVVLPFPKNEVNLKLLKRDRKNSYHTEYELKINPNNYFIKKDSLVDLKVTSMWLLFRKVILKRKWKNSIKMFSVL